jgi:hypothetical protein
MSKEMPVIPVSKVVDPNKEQSKKLGRGGVADPKNQDLPFLVVLWK